MAYVDKYGVEYSDDRKTLVKCPSDFKGEYVVPNSVTKIDSGAFFRCSSLTSILIPDSVSYIGFDAFFDCKSLTSITIPKGVEDISHGLFYGCKSLNSIELPHGVTCIGRDAFYYCESLKSVTLPDTITDIEEGAFAFCKSLVFVSIPNSVSSIGEATFSECKSLKTIKIPGGITCIESHTFNGCSNMASIQIPDSVKRIGESAFSGCKSLTCVTIPPKIKRIEDFTFCGCSGLTSIKIPEGVTSIGHASFWACKALTSIEMPSSVTTILNSTFAGCETNLQKFVVPLGQKARFAQMEGLEDLKDKIVERDNEELTILLNLAKAYEFGIGVSQNIAQSVLFYTQAAEKGCAEAAYRLAQWYNEGDVLPKDLNKALDLYRQALKAGYRDAETQIEEIKNLINIENSKQQKQNSGDPERFDFEKAFELYKDLYPIMDDFFHHGSCDGTLFVGPAYQDDFDKFWKENHKKINGSSWGIYPNKALLTLKRGLQYSLYFFYTDDNEWNSYIFKYNYHQNKWSCYREL